jgi:hypothetical protein
LGLPFRDPGFEDLLQLLIIHKRTSISLRLHLLCRDRQKLKRAVIDCKSKNRGISIFSHPKSVALGRKHGFEAKSR